MKITRLPDVQHSEGRSVAVGTFDGVHLGHREVIAGSDTVLTFDPHPVSVVAPQHTPKLLTTPQRKAELIASLGVQEMVVIPFDAEFAKRSADEFVADVLVGALGAKRVAIGENFRFGHKAQGDPRLLAADDRFATTVHPLLEVDGEIVSSSHIRGLVLAGELAEANRLLGAPSSCPARSPTATSAAASSAFPPPTSCPTRRSCAPATASTRASPTSPSRARRRRVDRRAPDVQHRPRRADRGLPAGLRGDLYGSR